MSHLLADTEELNTPGGVGFIDATDILKNGTEGMEFGTLLSVDGFTLQDAMSALEIMDPRMDSGMAEPLLPFDPHTPLLPSEVCWILDRAFACEMGWHTGLTLVQTVYTLQYVHHLTDIAYPRFDVGHGTRSSYATKDPERPIELVTLVLRSGVFGLLKCCDFVWRELANDHVVDGEDWSGEKFGVSLCESVQPGTLMSLLDQALNWLQSSSSLTSSRWRTPLFERISLRKNIFQTLAYPSFPALHLAKKNLEAIMKGPLPPEPPTMIKNVFDPGVARRLVTFGPTRIVDMPPQAEVWKSISTWLDGWEEVWAFVETKDLRSFQMLLSLRAYEEPSPRRSAFLRSLSISTFFNGQKILLSHDPPWLVDRFFGELASINAGLLSQLERCLSEESSDVPTQIFAEKEAVDGERDHASPANGENVTELFEKGLAKLLVDLFSSFFHNRARQRRKLAASLLDWHLAFDQALIVVARLSSFSPNPALDRVPLCIRHTRLSVIILIVFAGFELELYTSDEWAMVYWYAGEVLATQVAVLEELRSSISRDNTTTGSEATAYVSFQLEFFEALRCFSIAMRDVLYHYVPAKAKINASREQANFERRFKWAFVSGYTEAAVPDEDRPSLEKWREWRIECQLDSDSLNEGMDNLVRARDAFSRLSEYGPAHSRAVFCPEAYTDFMAGLVRACDATIIFLKMPPEIRNETGRDWRWSTSRWFPEIHIPKIPP